ncbi:hypothetical protein KSC_050650 [Ktedonobacter sp. SOSP1-52]|nr:hypothetical protein KSC_050650 [Ktedonobacter sp. SOSP1-52]
MLKLFHIAAIPVQPMDQYYADARTLRPFDSHFTRTLLISKLRMLHDLASRFLASSPHSLLNTFYDAPWTLFLS